MCCQFRKGNHHDGFMYSQGAKKNLVGGTNFLEIMGEKKNCFERKSLNFDTPYETQSLHLPKKRLSMTEGRMICRKNTYIKKNKIKTQAARKPNVIKRNLQSCRII